MNRHRVARFATPRPDVAKWHHDGIVYEELGPQDHRRREVMEAVYASICPYKNRSGVNWRYFSRVFIEKPDRIGLEATHFEPHHPFDLLDDLENKGATSSAMYRYSSTR